MQRKAKESFAVSDRYCYLGSGLAGCYGSHTPVPGSCTTSSMSGHYGPARPLFDVADEGCLVIATGHLLRRDPMLCMRAPLLDVTLAPGQRDAFDCESALAGMVLPAFARGSTEQRGLAALAIGDPSSFDHVAPDVYAAWWHSKGAHVGYVRGSTVEWLDGTVSTFDEAAARLDAWREGR